MSERGLVNWLCGHSNHGMCLYCGDKAQSSVKQLEKQLDNSPKLNCSDLNHQLEVKKLLDVVEVARKIAKFEPGFGRTQLREAFLKLDAAKCDTCSNSLALGLCLNKNCTKSLTFTHTG